jgi:hypothetical protein
MGLQAVMTRSSVLIVAVATCACALALGAAAACASVAADPAPPGSTGPNASGGSTQINIPDAESPIDPETGRPVVCDPETGECTCINIGMLGRLPSFGAVPGQDNTAALQAWLNAKSSAVVSVHNTDVELTPELLAEYDVLILQALEDQDGGPYWSHTPEEIANLEAWVRAGGGIIGLTGYGAQSAEVNPTNKLLAFTGFSYNTDDIFPQCPPDWNGCCYCLGNSNPVKGWNTAHPISSHITCVGAFHGRSINAPPEAEIVAQEGSLIYGATLQLDLGRIFMFADEWVTYTSQWTGEGLTDDCRNYDTNHSCYNIHPQNTYQVPQFWYNAIRWTSGDRECFVIDEPSIVY